MDTLKTLFISKAIMVCGIWMGAGIGAIFVKDYLVYLTALMATFMVIIWANKIV